MLAVHNLSALEQLAASLAALMRRRRPYSPTNKESTMEMQGNRALGVTQQQAWDALNDPEVLKKCIPGCDRFELTGENDIRSGWR